MNCPTPVPTVQGKSFCITASNAIPETWSHHLQFAQSPIKNPKTLISKLTWHRFKSRVFCSTGNATNGPWSPTQTLRRLIKSPGVHQGPACFDALSAKLIERAGFDFCFTSGFSISAARLGLPDTGLISMGEMVDEGLQITQAVSIPVIGDGDNGYGNAMNVKRTVKEYVRAGFAGIILEDQVSPKACGHTKGRHVVSREEAVMRIKAAIDAREESGRDIVIVARSDAKQADCFEEAIWRANAFAQAGADVLFIDALSSAEEMKYFCQNSTSVPKMANMLEGGGKTPILTPNDLEEIGFKLVAYPLSLIGVSIQAMMDSLTGLKGGRIPPPGSMPSFDELKDILGFSDYYLEEKRYSVSRTGIQVVTPEVYDEDTRSFSTKLRINITGQDGVDKLDIKIPAGFLDGVTNIVPALGGVDMKKMMDEVAGKGGKVLLDFKDTKGDRIRVSLE